jgi:hypothetical protein
MKKLLILIAAVVATAFIAGCASVPKHYNMTGTWQFTFEETGRDGVQTGSMTLVQEAYKLRGKCSDSFGEFDLTGSLSENGPAFMIAGKRNDFKRNFSFSGTLLSNDKFEGTYTTDQNTSGTAKGSKLLAK